MTIDQSSQYDVILDAREDRCPMPLLKAKLSLSKMQEGERLYIMAIDSGSLKDIPHYVEITELSLLSQAEENGVYTFLIQKN